jgi:hypothetical protein
MKRYFALVLVLILGALPTPLFAWGVDPTTNNKQFIAQTFSTLNAATTDKRPKGAYYQMSMVCTDGFFEVDLFKFTPQVKLAILGNIKSVTIRTQEKGRRIYKVVNLGPDALRLTESKTFYRFILDQKRIGVYFKMENGEDYRAYFDVSGASTLAKKFAAVGCKV